MEMHDRPRSDIRLPAPHQDGIEVDPRAIRAIRGEAVQRCPS